MSSFHHTLFFRPCLTPITQHSIVPSFDLGTCTHANVPVCLRSKRFPSRLHSPSTLFSERQPEEHSVSLQRRSLPLKDEIKQQQGNTAPVDSGVTQAGGTPAARYVWLCACL